MSSRTITASRTPAVFANLLLLAAVGSAAGCARHGGHTPITGDAVVPEDKGFDGAEPEHPSTDAGEGRQIEAAAIESPVQDGSIEASSADTAAPEPAAHDAEISRPSFGTDGGATDSAAIGTDASADLGDGQACRPFGGEALGLKDQYFGNPSAWTTRGVTFEPDLFGPGDGVVRFSPVGRCGTSSVSQTFDMPCAADAPPQVFEVEYFGVEPSGACNSEASLVIGGVPQPLPMPGQNGRARVCLGARAYGPSVSLALQAKPESTCPSLVSCEARSYGGISVVRATPAECGAPGSFGNADFATLGTMGWSPAEGTKLHSGAGALVLSAHNGCEAALTSNSVSIPFGAVLPYAAIRFDAQLQLGPRAGELATEPYIEVGFDTDVTPLRRARLTPGEKTRVVTCVPSFASGTARAFLLSGPRSNVSCLYDAENPIYSIAISELALVSDPDCNVSHPELDFEGIPTSKAPWELAAETADHARFEEDPAHVHSGLRALRLTAGVGCETVVAQIRAMMPSAKEAHGIMLRFWHRMEGTPGEFYVSSTPFGANFDPNNQWQRREVCIPREFSGQLMTLAWQVQGAANCHLETTARTIWIDDIELSQSTACP